MSQPAVPIRLVLMRIVWLSSLAVLLVTTTTFCAYELTAFRRTSRDQLRTLDTVIASNSTAALAFDNATDAAAVLAALKAEPHIRAAALYDNTGRLFATYPQQLSPGSVPARIGPLAGRQLRYVFTHDRLSGFQPVVQDGERLGTLYVQSDLGAMYARMELYALLVMLVVAVSLPLAFLIARRLQQRLSTPILALADTARAVSDRQDYGVRAALTGTYEFDLFVGAFNEMLTRVQQSERKLTGQLARLNLLHHITRATGERQDLPSILQVVLGSLEADLGVDLGCFLLHDPLTKCLSVTTVGAGGHALAASIGLVEHASVSVDENGLSRCLAGQLVYEPELQEVTFPFPQRLAGGGLRAMVIAPLAVETQVFGALVCARREPHSFSSGECEFLQQLCEHVALASHQGRLYGALQQAYEDLRQTQQTVMQQERLRALGQMASGIAHDINNAISPVSLYTEALLEREQLSARARGYLGTIQRAIEDVSRTVARMREFYREREAQLTLERVDLNQAIRQVVELTRPRWNDQPQQRGVMIELRTELAQDLPPVMGAEHEIRDALTNLVFNAVDAMPQGGTLTLRTLRSATVDASNCAVIEVSDTGIGMDEDTRRRCLEPFFTTKGERGTGLGLAMVYGMVQRHSAQLAIDSSVGRGTTVRLSFAAQSLAQAGAASVRARRELSLRRLRILLVDDDPLLIKSLHDTLQDDGHVLTVTHGGQAGIDAFAAALERHEPFDVVITDLGMPHVDGRKVAAQVRTLSPRMPVILLTGWGQRMLEERSAPPHVSKVLAKPPRLQELREALDEVVA